LTSPNGTCVLAFAEDETTLLWCPKRTLLPTASRVLSAAFTRDGKRLATLSADGVVRIWGTESPSEITDAGVVLDFGSPLSLAEPFSGLSSAPDATSVAFNLDGTRVLAACPAGAGEVQVRIWDADGRGKPITLHRKRDGVVHLRLSEDGRFLFVAGRNGDTYAWGIDGLFMAKEACRLAGQESAVREEWQEACGNFADPGTAPP
jgi:WD40 repeat protein